MMKVKQWLRCGVCLSFAVLFCLSLCSCRQLDDIKSRHAKWNDGHTEMTMDGKVYRRLPEEFTVNDAMLPENGNVTNADVPVLLSEFCGETIEMNTDHTVIRSSLSYYATDEAYNLLAKEYEKGDYNRYMMVQWKYGDVIDLLPVFLSDEYTALINRILAPENKLESVEEDSEKTGDMTLSLSRCSESGLLSDANVFFWAEYNEDDCLVYRMTVIPQSDYAKETEYKIPSELKDAVAKMVDDCTGIIYGYDGSEWDVEDGPADEEKSV